jgi:tripartite-type tricarboxylate transporter receptor subunit TctC
MRFVLSFILACVLASSDAGAGEFDPTKKNIEIIVPYKPGGTTDAIGRVIQLIFTQKGWKSVVINKPGASTVLASNYIANEAPKDGHTIYIGGTGFLDANIAFEEDSAGVKYKVEDFAPIVPLGTGTLVLSSSKDSGLASYDDFKKYIKANPDQFKVGFWSTATGKVFSKWAELEGLPQPQMVYYNGSASQITDILGGHIKFTFDSFTATNKHYEAGALNILAVLDDRGGLEKINKVKPNSNVISVPRLHPSFELYTYYGVFAPAGVDPEVIQEINTVINSALKKQEILDFFTEKGVLNVGGTPEQLSENQQKLYNLMKTVGSSK